MSHTIPVSSLHIASNRQRREFDPVAMMELVDSIQSKGLFHPIVIRITPGECTACKYTLVAGERRLRAIQDLWAIGGLLRYNGQAIQEGFIPIVSLGELSPLDAEEAELEENSRRADLTWQELAAANARLAQLRTKQAELAGTPVPTVNELAQEIRGTAEGYAGERTRQELIVAKHLGDEEIAGAKTIKEAFKILRRKEDVKRNLRLSEHVGQTFSAAEHRLFLGPFEKWMADMPAESFDVILTDPPYGMGAQDFGDSGGLISSKHAYDDSFPTWDPMMCVFALGAYRVAKAQAHAYLFCDIENFKRLKEHMVAAGWTVHRTPLIWHKPNGQRAPWPEHGPQRKYEVILYAMKGKKPTTKLAPDLVAYTADENLGHAAQKPVALYVDLLKRSVRPGDTVLDAFAGSGTVFPAAHELQCAATGIELDPNHYGIAVKRIESLT